MRISLKDKQILVTRPIHQAKNLIQLIEQHGGQAISFPTLEIVPVSELKTAQAKLENLKTYQWLIFISANAVNFAVAANNGKIRDFTQTKIAAVGKATAKALENQGITVDCVPEAGFNSEALLASATFQSVEKQKILIVRGIGGRELLAEELQKRGAKVDYCEVYQRQMPKTDNRAVVDLLNRQQLAILTATSVEALQNLKQMLEPHSVLLRSIPLVVISARIQKIAQDFGFKKVVVSSSPDDVAILNTLIMLTNGEDSD